MSVQRFKVINGWQDVDGEKWWVELEHYGRVWTEDEDVYNETLEDDYLEVYQ